MPPCPAGAREFSVGGRTGRPGREEPTRKLPAEFFRSECPGREHQDGKGRTTSVAVRRASLALATRLVIFASGILLIFPLRVFPSSLLWSDYSQVQTAGFAGVVAAGLGWEMGPHHEINSMLGYVPEWVTGFELWQLTTKYEYHPFADAGGGGVKPSPLYFGFGLIYGHSTRLHFGDLPEQYPNPEYYPETAFRCTVNVGTAFAWGGTTAYIEYAALCLGVIAYNEDPKWFQEHYRAYGLEGIGSLGFGLKTYFQ